MNKEIWEHMPDDVMDDVVVKEPIKEQKKKGDLKEPPKYAVIFFNDDFTPMDFVINLLQKYFGHGLEQATFIMLDVHEKGKGVAGIYSKDIAETKAAQCNVEARANDHPLSVISEPEN